MLELKQLAADERPHLIALTESWLTTSDPDGELSINGYYLIRQDSTRGRAGGVLLFVSDLLPPSFKVSHAQIPLIDSLWVKFSFTSSDSLLLGLIYRSPSASTESNQALLDQLKGMGSSKDISHLLILGDFNAPGISWPSLSSSSSFGQSLVDIILEQAWSQHVSFPTRYREGQTPSLLDLVITNESHFVDLVRTLPPLGKSDHIILHFDLITRWPLLSPSKTLVRSFKRTNFHLLKDYLRSQLNLVSWEPFPDNLNGQLEKIIQNADSLLVPRVRKSPGNKPPLPRCIRHLMDARSKAFARYKLTNLSEDAATFRQLRNLLKSRIRFFHLSQQSELLYRAQSNRSILYRYLRSTRKLSPSPLALSLPDGSPATTPHQVADTFLKYFEPIFNSHPPSPPDLPPPSIYPPHLEHFHITQQAVEDKLKRLNPFSSMGPDTIHPRILKETAEVIAPLYTQLFQLCLDTGTFPSSWKQAMVAPIYKKGDRHLPESYRPISLTSVPCKVFERLIKTEILSHLHTHKLITPHQHGFLPHRSCITNMLTVMDSLTQAYDNGEISHAIFIDFAKAFDRVPHNLLLLKLQWLGIQGRLLSLLRSFLSDRSFQVRVNSTLSQPATISAGVPQGSVLGPLLFLIFINDLPSVIPSNVAIYADDVTIWGTNSSVVQSAMDHAKRWSSDWGLPINDNKCVSMSFGRASDQHFWIDGTTQLQKVDQHKILGFWLNSSLSFSSHQQKAGKSAFCILHMIRRSFPQISPTAFPLLFGTYIRPILEYGSQIAYSGLVKDRELLERVQRRATKMVLGLHNLPYPDRLSALNLYPLDTRRIRGDLFLLFNLFASGLVDQFFCRSNLAHLRGNTKKLFKPRPRTTLRSNYFTHRVVPLWNSLPEDVVSAPSKEAFKVRLDRLLGLRPLPISCPP